LDILEHGIEVVVIEAFAPVKVDFGVREGIDARLHFDLIDITESDKVFTSSFTDCVATHATDSNDGHIDLGSLTRLRDGKIRERRRSSSGRSPEELSTRGFLHDRFYRWNPPSRKEQTYPQNAGSALRR